MTIDTYVVDAKSGKATILKDPDANLDYTFNWTLWLDDVLDTIFSKQALEFAADDGTHITIVSSSIDVTNKKVIIQLSGGTINKIYQVTCRITTLGPPVRVDDRSIYVKIKDR